MARTALLSGDVDAAESYSRRALDLAQNGEASVLRPMLQAVRAQVELSRGRPRGALRELALVFDGVDLATTTLKDREAHETAWRAYRAAGQPAEALPHLEALKRLDDEATALATSTNTALMGARFDFANQELRIATLKADELRRSVAAEREQARLERLIFAGAALVTLALLTMLGAGLVTIGRSRNAVRSANKELEDTNAELARALAARTEFLATTSHEIRTPLNGILGMTQVMLADRTLQAPARDRVEVVHAAGVAMRGLVDDILDAAKIESGRLVLDRAPFDLRAELLEAVRLWEPTLRARGIAFAARMRLPEGEVEGDATRVGQVVSNLLSNAAKFTQSGRVLLTARREGDTVSIAVSDTGVGVPADKMEAVFESFRQADAGTARRFGGTGLGLSICRHLARAMGGDVTLRSREGRGSRFTFTVPLPFAASPADAAATTGSRGKSTDPPLLILDANPISRAMLRSLAEGAGLMVLAAADLDQGMAEGPPGAVLLDGSVVPPGVAGEQVLARLRELSVPTALLLPADRPAPGWPEVVRKPISGPELLRRLPRPGSDPSPDRPGSLDDGLVSRAA